MNWYWSEATDEERRLHDKMGELDDCFLDMRFEPDTAPYKLIRCQSKIDESDEWFDDEAPRPEELEYFSYTFFKTRIVDLDDCLGCYNAAEQTLSVAPVAVGENSVLLHEMIHLHESMINELPLHYHDMLLWSLYQDLREKIRGLDDAINQHAHILNEHTIYSQGGLHDILFLLKSFDLDIRYQYPLGTVFGYGRIDDFKYLQYD